MAREESGAARHMTIGKHAVRSARRHSSIRKRVTLSIAAILTVGTTSAALWLRSDQPPIRRGTLASGTVKESPSVEPFGLPSPDLLRPLTATEAIVANAEKSLAVRSDSPAAPFVTRGDVITKMRALDCLAQAVYYEAASEGVDGGRAVAQIVLNRVRHPSYPNAVCSVVYQGSNRSTGCQFTFTCDGSLRRIPLTYLWSRARLIASEALAGRVFSPVGHATHYHADYVLPYWADSLDKVAVVSRHIFYRIRGASGASEIFSQRYSGVEPSPPLIPSTEVIEIALDIVTDSPAISALPPLPRVEEDRVEKLTVGSKIDAPSGSSLQADLSRGTLIIGEPTANVKKKTPNVAECQGDGPGKIEATRSQDLITVSDKRPC